MREKRGIWGQIYGQNPGREPVELGQLQQGMKQAVGWGTSANGWLGQNTAKFIYNIFKKILKVRLSMVSDFFIQIFVVCLLWSDLWSGNSKKAGG